MVKKQVISLDPNLFSSGDIGLKAADYDEHFGNNSEPTLKMVIDVFLSLLPENHRSAIEMCVMSNITYEEAAQRISIDRGIKTDKKTVWRWAQTGIEQLRKWLTDSPWVAPLTNHKIPIEAIKSSLPPQLPWEDDDGSL